MLSKPVGTKPFQVMVNKPSHSLPGEIFCLCENKYFHKMTDLSKGSCGVFPGVFEESGSIYYVKTRCGVCGDFKPESQYGKENCFCVHCRENVCLECIPTAATKDCVPSFNHLDKLFPVSSTGKHVFNGTLRAESFL